jgi:transposase-like protein|tara:strand:+ start:555 stop:971 length:417 start_codon:yes stop_codon:yes gene_type:complete
MRKKKKSKHWKRGDPHFTNKNPNFLEGIPSIAEFIGKSYDTTYKWITKHGLPATKTPSGRWITHKGLIMQWIVAGHQAELKAKARYTLEDSEIEALAREFKVDVKKVFNLRDEIRDERERNRTRGKKEADKSPKPAFT